MDVLKSTSSSYVQNVIKNMILTSSRGRQIRINLSLSEAEVDMLQAVKSCSLIFSTERLYIPGEPKSGGHLTITHQMLASTFRAFRVRSLLRSDKIL